MKLFIIFLSFATVVGSTSLQQEAGPVSRVVGLLGQLKTRIEKDGESEQANYDKYACWCEKTTGKTAATIISVKEVLKTTGNTILKLKGSVATLSSEIAGLVADIKANQDQQEELTGIREKENTAFMAEKVELESAVSALDKAMTVLKAATGGASFVQTEKWASTMSEVVSVMTEASSKLKMDDNQISLLRQLSGKSSASYSPQSATITGILSDMYSTFSKNLQTSIADEATAHRNFEDLMATLQKSLNTLQETLVKKEQKKAEDTIQLADATQTYADSEEQLKAEIASFDATKASCTEKTADWSKRSSLRTAELEGITKAITILSSDESKELFAKSIKPGFSKGGAASFLQVSTQRLSAGHAQKAFTALLVHARQTGSFRLAALAAQVKTRSSGHFDAVLATIDKLLASLKEEEQADITKVDGCKESYQSIGLKKEDLGWKIDNNKAKVQGHEKAVEQKTAAEEIVVENIADAENTLDELQDQRTEENEAYVQAKKDDEKAIGLLGEAKEALGKYFAKEKSLMQQDPEPELKLSGKDSAKGQTNGIVALLDLVIEDLNSELAESKAAEEAAQLSYETMKAAVEDQKEKLERAEINLQGQIAEEGTAKDAEVDLQTENEKNLGNEETTETDLKKSCDDAIKLQPERRKKRESEADGLTQAREFLAGMQADALVQTKTQASLKTVFPAFQSLSFLQRRG